jgi:Zn ribbon nucleic-acid-binding protein
MESQGDAKCAHCGAAYKVTWVRSAWPSNGIFECVECGSEMERWDATLWPSYRRAPFDDGSAQSSGLALKDHTGGA